MGPDLSGMFKNSPLKKKKKTWMNFKKRKQEMCRHYFHYVAETSDSECSAGEQFSLPSPEVHPCLFFPPEAFQPDSTSFPETQGHINMSKQRTRFLSSEPEWHRPDPARCFPAQGWDQAGLCGYSHGSHGRGWESCSHLFCLEHTFPGVRSKSEPVLDHHGLRKIRFHAGDTPGGFGWEFIRRKVPPFLVAFLPGHLSPPARQMYRGNRQEDSR